MSFLAAIHPARPQRFSSAVMKINYPIHRGRPNPAHSMFFIVGTIPVDCYDASRNGGVGGSKLYSTEDQAIRALINAGADFVQGVDNRVIDIATYVAELS